MRWLFLAVFLLFYVAGSLSGISHCWADEETQPDLEIYRGQIIANIQVAGNQVTKDWVIAREIWTTEGQKLDPDLIAQDITRLENLAIFGSVLVTPTPQAGGVALNYHFTEMPWIIPYPAINYNEENGFSLGVGVASPNFAGRRISLSGSAVYGGATQYRLSASNPWITGNHVSGGISFWDQSRRNELLEFQQHTNFLAFNAGKYIGQNGRLNSSVGYYRVKSDQPDRTLSADNADNLLFAGISVGYDGRDSWRNPHEGWHNELELLYIGGDANSWTLSADVRRYEPIGDRHTIATGPFLALQSGTVNQDVPSYMQFFVGGANSIRGYKLEELGKEIYGKNQLLYTLEYRYLLVQPTPIKVFKWTFSLGLEMAAFGDAGLAWSRSNDFNMARSRAGYGVGLRLLVPGMESLRLDVGRNQFGDFEFNFGVRAIFDERKKRVR